jgi:uncharacterized repeat protein (TIGR03803 family)
MRSSRKIGNHGRAGLLLLGASALVAPIGEAAAASYQVLYSFCSQYDYNHDCIDGGRPNSGLVVDAAGNLYGTTGYGGGSSIPFGGVVFKLAQNGAYTVLHNFCSQNDCADGRSPQGGLTSGDFLSGTTVGGGTADSGVVFTLVRRPPPFEGYMERVLYNFCSQSGCSDGAYPQAGLIDDAAANLYGTTREGGTAGAGVVFKRAPDGTETVLYSFCSQSGCADGANPTAGLLMDGAGNLYGMTPSGGGAGAGVVFKLAPDGTQTVLYSFCAQVLCVDGANPQGGLIIDAAGNLYGTTFSGGDHDGVVFQLAPDGTETVLYRFCSQTGCADGAHPAPAGLVMDAAGSLYGITRNGGASGQGVVFKLAPDGTESVLYSFCSQSNCTDGAAPSGGLIIDPVGNLYGMTSSGGAVDHGVVFILTP